MNDLKNINLNFKNFKYINKIKNIFICAFFIFIFFECKKFKNQNLKTFWKNRLTLISLNQWIYFWLS